VKARVFIVEDHEVMRERIEQFVASLPALELCGSAASAEEALERLGEADAALVLLDISLPRMSGLDFLRKAKLRWPATRFVVLSGHDEAAYSARAFRDGAQAYVSKGDTQRLREAIECVLRGEEYPPRAAGALAQAVPKP